MTQEQKNILYGKIGTFYQEYCKSEGIECLSMDEMPMNELTPLQQSRIADYQRVWISLDDCEVYRDE